MSTGSRIRAARESLGLSQRAAARLAGCSHVHLGHVERDMRTASVALLTRIADVLHTTTDALTGGLSASERRTLRALLKHTTEARARIINAMKERA